MTDKEKDVVKAVKLIREHCKGTGCLYCMYHRKYEALTKDGPVKRECCALDNYPRNWPENIGEEANK